jgi:hypothetical protein
MRGMSVVLVGAMLILAGCGSSDEETAATAPSEDSNAATTTAAPEETTALEGTWQTDPITVDDMTSTLRENGLAEYVGDFEKNAPVSDAPTALILDVGDPQGGRREKIDYDAQFEVRGNTVVVTHSTGESNTYRWSVRDEVLELTWLKGTAGPYRGIPDEVFQRALYTTADFHGTS